MLPAVAAAVSASETAAVTWALKARAVTRNVSAACCVFLPTVDVVVFRFCCFCVFAVFTVIWLWGGKGDVACFTVSVASPYIRLAVAFAAAQSDWRAKQAHWHMKTHTHTRTHTKASTEISAIKSFIYFILYFFSYLRFVHVHFISLHCLYINKT